MNRRRFFQMLGVGTAALYLRLAPATALAVPANASELVASWSQTVRTTSCYSEEYKEALNAILDEAWTRKSLKAGIQGAFFP